MFKGVIPMIFGLALAGGLSQFPEFAQQYSQRVAGAYFEVRDVAERFRVDAAANGKTTTEAIAAYQTSDNAFFRDRGTSMKTVLAREIHLQDHYAALTNGDGFEQLVVFATGRDNEIAMDTLGIFKPAIPLTFTGFAHAALGFLFGYGLLRFPVRIRRRRAPKSA